MFTCTEAKLTDIKVKLHEASSKLSHGFLMISHRNSLLEFLETLYITFNFYNCLKSGFEISVLFSDSTQQEELTV